MKGEYQMSLEILEAKEAIREVIDGFANLECNVPAQMVYFTEDVHVMVYMGDKLTMDIHGRDTLEKQFSAFTGGIKDDILDLEELAVKLVEILARDYPARLTERYKVTDFAGMEPYELLQFIGRKRGMLVSGGEVDTLRASQMLLDELRGGKLGKITFEQPE